MENEADTVPPAPLASDEAVSSTMRKGFEKIVVQTTAGLVLGGMAGVVLARGGASGARKIVTGLGGGIGLGSAWTRCSIELEDLISSSSSK